MMAQSVLAGWFCRPSQAAKQRVTVALERVDMLHLADRSLGELSGGQQQRVFFWPVPWPRMPTCCCLMSPSLALTAKPKG